MGRLADFLMPFIPPGELEFPVINYVREGAWRWDVIRQVVPSNICDRIATLKPPEFGFTDFPCWNLTSTGDFSLKSAYIFILCLCRIIFRILRMIMLSATYSEWGGKDSIAGRQVVPTRSGVSEDQCRRFA